MHTVPRKRSNPAAAAMPEGAATRECTRARCSVSGSRNYADSKDGKPATRGTAPGKCKQLRTTPNSNFCKLSSECLALFRALFKNKFAKSGLLGARPFARKTNAGALAGP